jgi:small GTP-binding protein
MNKIKRRVLVLGESAVGKSSMIEFYCTGNTQPNYKMTKGCDVTPKLIELGDKDIEFYFMDMSGKDIYRSIVAKMCKDPHMIVLAYDSTDAESFRALDSWLDLVKKTNGNKEFSGIIVSTKNDLTSLRMVDRNEGAEKARRMRMGFFEVTCSNYESIDKAFSYLVEKTLE